VVDPRRHLIYVGGDLELESALTDKALMDNAETEELADPPAGHPPPPGADAERDYAAWEGDPRLRALLQLICGDDIQCVSDEPVPPIVQGMIEGRREIPIPAGVPHKYFIFAMHAESSRQIAAGLDAVGIKYACLRGTRREKDKAVRRFKTRHAPDAIPADDESVDVVIATSSRDCAGLHIPEITRLVLYHRHVDEDVAKQAVGRGQRVGREVSLEVLEFVSEGEAERFR
jgi:hypothetical protein